MAMFYFPEDISERLLALRQSNERILRLAVDLGADPRDVSLLRLAILGVLSDVATSFGLNRAETTALTFPIATRYASSDDELER